MTTERVTPAALIIMDGFGIAAQGEGNAISLAKTPQLDALFARESKTQLQASGEAVGLPDGQMGNSEVGHLNIGAGRIVYQELTRITKDIQDGVFFEKEPLIWAMDSVKENGGNLHLMGLLSDGGVLIFAGVLLDGTIADESRRDRDTVAAREAEKHLLEREDAQVTRLPIGAGAVALIKK